MKAEEGQYVVLKDCKDNNAILVSEELRMMKQLKTYDLRWLSAIMSFHVTLSRVPPMTTKVGTGINSDGSTQ